MPPVRLFYHESPRPGDPEAYVVPGITFADIFAVQPFGNDLVVMTSLFVHLLDQLWNFLGRVLEVGVEGDDDLAAHALEGADRLARHQRVAMDAHEARAELLLQRG